MNQHLLASIKTQEIPYWLYLAFLEIGTEEVSGPGYNDQIIKYHSYTSLKSTTDEVAWCSSFVNYLMGNSELKGTSSAAARSWLGWGKRLDKPALGCVVVFWRGSPDSWMGHVGLYIGEDSKSIYCLGGNQSNKVSVEKYSKAQLLSYRWPKLG